MKFARFVVLGLAAFLAPISGFARSHQKHSTLSSPYSVGGKHAKHNTYKYLAKKGKHGKVKQYRSPVSGEVLYGKAAK